VKLDMRRFSRPTIAGIGVVIILVAVLWLNHLLLLPHHNLLQPLPKEQTDSGGSQPSGNVTITSPDVNPAAFKDQGDLAFIWQDLLYTLDGATGEVKQLTESGQVSQPAWSHDGQWLAFIRVTDPQAGTGLLWLVRRDGSQAHQVQGLPGPVAGGAFSWSPTDNVLAVTQNGIWLVPAEGEPNRLSQSGACYLAWSPDGRSLAYNITLPSDEPQNRTDALYTIAVDGGQPVERLTAPQGGMLQVTAWWPDGKGLLYWSAPVHSSSLAADGLDLWSLRLGDTGPKLLTKGLTHKGWLSLSPQGNLLMVTGDWRIVWARKSLAAIDPASGTVRDLNNPEGCVSIDPAFSPDGRRIAFVAAKNLGDEVWGFDHEGELADWVATRTLWVQNSDGSGAYPLTDAGAGVFQPFWSIGGDHILYVRDNALWIIEPGGGKPEKVLGPFPEQKELFGFYGFVSYLDKMAWRQS
jgi:Tol biopolymer transport system component